MARVLIIEDEESLRQLFQVVLEAAPVVRKLHTRRVASQAVTAMRRTARCA